MGTKRHKPEDVVAKLRQVDVLVSQGELCRILGDGGGQAAR
ncbi:hypothetical protein J2W80_006319 [Methylorubrum extorquens]|nr:hypothetical protein [Methylorubrum extorquens]MCP1591094.1 hypothetical protein [Methylorubrum extorquens]